MVNEYIRYRIPAEQASSFLSAYAQAAAYLQASHVCLAYEMSRCEEEADCFILRIVWRSTEDHLKTFRASAEFRGFLSCVKPYVSNIEEMRHYALTDLRWSRGD